jgi:hypothetical protein
MQDPKALELHGYGKFIKRNELNKPAKRYIRNDTVLIRYSMELIVATGGVLQIQSDQPIIHNDVQVAPSRQNRTSDPKTPWTGRVQAVARLVFL